MNFSKAKQKGFTLVEIMIVVAILGILTSIALPSYSGYVNRARVTEATSQLADMRVQMEQYFQDNRTYAGSTAAGEPCEADNSGEFFNIACGTPDATTYTITATGKGAMLNDFLYTVNQANAKTSEFEGVTANGCWATSKGGCPTTS